jgi:DNA-binding NtrC family response regulator
MLQHDGSMKGRQDLAARARRANGCEDQRFETLYELAKDLLAQVESLEATMLPDVGRGICLQDEVRRFEVTLINNALKCAKGRQSRAAQMLGLSNSTLNTKIKTYDILIDGRRVGERRKSGSRDDASAVGAPDPRS